MQGSLVHSPKVGMVTARLLCECRTANARAQPVVAWCGGRARGMGEKEKGLVHVLHAKREPQKVHVGPTYFGRSRSLNRRRQSFGHGRLQQGMHGPTGNFLGLRDMIMEL